MKSALPFLKKNKWFVSITILVFAIMVWLSWPKEYFSQKPYSHILLSAEGQLLSAKIAADGQWRFPPIDSIPNHYEDALLHFEDEYFLLHPGINPFSLVRALWQNLRAGKVVSGGSTISMQVVRMSNDNPSRTLSNKLKELLLALRLEWQHGKNEILNMYASHAPFGGNVVGISAASWRYFGRSVDNLSLAEYALLAVLPNAPGLIHPGRNSQKLLSKRNILLKKLHENEIISDTEYSLSLLEKLPSQPHALPNYAPHALQSAMKKAPNKVLFQSHLNENWQRQVGRVINRYSKLYAKSKIYNAASVVAHIASGEIKAYVGNQQLSEFRNKAAWVDINQSLRSTGSVLKPFLYAAMLEDGSIFPNTLVEDLPIYLNGYSPKNYGKSYDGVVPAAKALSRSLNVPAVKMLQDFGYPKFHNRLKQMGMKTLAFPPSHYGLSIILGGAEGSLHNITEMYANLGRCIQNFNPNFPNKKIASKTLRLFQDGSREKSEFNYPLSAGSAWLTLKAMQDVFRPDNEEGWQNFSSSQNIAWKTGTSFGYRDAWAVGLNGEYAVGVWVGNADGQGRDGLVGVSKAAPILFDVFDLLPTASYFKKPIDDLELRAVCAESGHPPNPSCPAIDSTEVPFHSHNLLPCPYHRTINIDKKTQLRANINCAARNDLVQQPWFVLNPVQAYYFKQKNTWYKELPAWKIDCSQNEGTNLQFIYPAEHAKLKIPRELNGNLGSLVFEVAHRRKNATLYWHLDGKLIFQSRTEHSCHLRPSVGKHRILVIDNKGQAISRSFEVVG